MTKPAMRPLVFVHGVYHGAWCFEEHFVPYFTGLGHPCHAITLRGHGAGAARPCRFTRRHYFEDLRAAVARIEPAPLLVGHSLGGVLIQDLLAAGVVRDGVLLAPPTPAALVREALRLMARRPASLKAFLRFDLDRIYHHEDVARRSFFASDLPRAAFERHLSRLREISYGGLAFLRTVLTPVRRAPRGASAPRVLVVGGAEDPTCTPPVLAGVARLYGTAPVVVPGVSHDLMLDTRWRDAADVIAAWMRAERAAARAETRGRGADERRGGAGAAPDPSTP